MKKNPKWFQKTIFCDLDGCIVKHNMHPEIVPDVFLDDAINKLIVWKGQGHYIILTTARKEKHCKKLLEYLKQNYNLYFDQCIFDLPAGQRYLINDYEDEYPTAVAINIKRNNGLKNIRSKIK